MSKTRQSTQLRPSDTYDDSLPAGPTLETGATSGEDDLNAIRSQLRRVIDPDGSWTDAPATSLSKPGRRGKVVASTTVNSGPAAGYAPATRTFEDGTVQTFSYLADGFSVDTILEQKSGQPDATYTAVYSVDGIRTHWVKS